MTTDSAGNTHTSAAVSVAVDNTAPSAPAVTLSESSQYAYVSGQTVFVNTGQSGSYGVDATSSDAQSGIEKIRFPGPVDDTSSPYGTSYGFGDFSGSQTVTAYNNAGLTASDTFTVTPDTSGPNAFSLSAPGAGASIANGQTVSASSADDGSGMDKVEFRYCAGSSCSFAAGTTIGAPDATAPYSVTWSGQPADGTYTIVARATDNVGNTIDSAERTVTVDNTGPSSVLSVNEGARPDLQYFDSATDTYYYNPAATGGFSVHDVAGDPAGVASVDFPAIGDTGFSGSAKNDTTSPYDSNTYTFTTASASAPRPRSSWSRTPWGTQRTTRSTSSATSRRRPAAPSPTRTVTTPTAPSSSRPRTAATPVRASNLLGRPRAPHVHLLRGLMRRLLRRLEHGDEPRHRRVRPLRPVPLPRLRPRRQRGRSTRPPTSSGSTRARRARPPSRSPSRARGPSSRARRST